MDAIVKINMFTKTQSVYLSDNTSATGFSLQNMDLEKIPSFLMSIYDLQNVHIFGDEKYITNLVNKIKDAELVNYHCNKINILINK